MKTFFLALLMIVTALPAAAASDAFLGVPLPPKGEVVRETGARLEMTTPLSHEDVVAYYQNVLKDMEDIKFRNWKDATYIEDNGKRRWHSVTISKGGGEATRITVMKDNWTWILGTLVLRFVGVFVVLMILFVAMSFAGSLISRFVRHAEKKGAAPQETP